jgi:hypothetical protein
MAYPAYVRDKARALRRERLSIVEISERLALPKATIYYWVRDLPLGRARRENPNPGTRAMQRKYRLLREAAYEEGRRTFDDLAAGNATFRDFICMYLGEGSKRDRNSVALGNSDPEIVALAAAWMRRLSRNPLRFELQYHADQDLTRLRAFWGERLGIDPASVSVQRKSNSGQLAGRSWRSRYGVLTVRARDTLLRARLQGWMDRLQEQWLHSPHAGRSSVW